MFSSEGGVIMENGKGQGNVWYDMERLELDTRRARAVG